MPYQIARSYITNKSLQNAANHIGEAVYSQPYTERRRKIFHSNFTYKCSDGTVIHRPNHNMGNILRSLYYLKPVIQYFNASGNDETQALMQNIEAQDIKKIMFMQLFYTSGRQCELGFNDDPQIAAKARFDAGNNFKLYFEGKNDSGDSIEPFTDMAEVERYSQILEQIYGDDGTPKEKAVRLLLRTSHELDLLRCYTPKRLDDDSIFTTLRKHSRHPDNRDVQKLLLYSQHCITETGDILRTAYKIDDIHGVHEATSFKLKLQRKKLKIIRTGNYSIVRGAKARDDEKFIKASRVDLEGIAKTLETLEKVVEPEFFISNKDNINTTSDDPLELIRSGNAMARTINGSHTSKSTRFELEQLTNPHNVRPMRAELLARKHNLKVDLKTGAVNELQEKNYTPFEAQAAVIAPLATKQKTQASKDEDRGKPKNTIFQKKCSFRLVPENGILPVFTGRYQDSWFKPGFIAVGLLHNQSKMNLHNEKYIWAADARTSGIDGYFWLAKSKDKQPTTLYPGLQKLRDESHCKDLQDLKDKVNAPDAKISSEVLAGGSLNSLTAIYTVSQKREHVLAAIHLQNILRRDYNVERPIILMDGINTPRLYSNEELEQIYNKAVKKQNKWWRRILNWFFPSLEKTLIGAIQAASSKKPFIPLVAPVEIDASSQQSLKALSHSNPFDLLETIEEVDEVDEDLSDPNELNDERLEPQTESLLSRSLFSIFASARAKSLAPEEKDCHMTISPE